MARFDISYVYQIIDKASPAIKKINAGIKKVDGAFRRSGRGIKNWVAKQRAAAGDVGTMWGKTAGIMAAGFAAAMPIKKAMEFEDVMADVAKVIDFKEPDGLKKMEGMINRLTTKLPVTAVGIAQIVEAGAQAGVQTKDLEKFAVLASKVKVAFGVTADEAGESMAKLANLFGKEVSEMETVADTINYLSDNTAAKAKDIVTALRRGAGEGASLLGLSAEQASGMSAALVSIGITASTSGERIRQFGKVLTNTDRVTKVLGKSAVKAFKTDPVKSFRRVLELLSTGEMTELQAFELFGESSGTVVTLSKALGVYDKAMGIAADKTSSAGSMQKEFEKKSQTTINKLIILGNQVDRVSRAIGDSLLPAIKQFSDAVSPMITKVAEWIKANETFVSGLGLLAGAFLAAKLAAILFGLVLAANPFTLIAAAIGAAVMAVLDLIDKLGGLERVVKLAPGAFKLLWGDTVKWFKTHLYGVLMWFRDQWNSTVTWFKSLWEGVLNWFGNLWDRMFDFSSMFAGLNKMFAKIQAIQKLDLMTFSGIQQAIDIVSGDTPVAPAAMGQPGMNGNIQIDVKLSGERSAVEEMTVKKSAGTDRGINLAYQ